MEFGRYHGVQGQIGFDGYWKSPKDFHIVTETKTTDAYTIKTATLTGYIDALISDRKIANWDKALGLYIVGRPDAELKQLENAIIAERRTDRLRVISVDSLLSLAELMSKYDVTHQAILEVLRPSGPRIDPIVDLIAGLVAEPQDEPGVPEAEAIGISQAGNVQPVSGRGVHEDLDTSEAAFWLTPVKSSDEETAEECISRLVNKDHYYAFGERAAGRRHMKAGDRIGFYATTKGVVAHATLSSPPKKKPRPDGSTSEDYPWICSLKDVNLYLNKPVAIDAKLRPQLDAFKLRNPGQAWAWFVQATHKITSHDFELLTRVKRAG